MKYGYLVFAVLFFPALVYGQQSPSPFWLRHGPPIESVQPKAVSKALGFKSIDSWTSRARWSHALPNVELDIGVRNKHYWEGVAEEEYERLEEGQMLEKDTKDTEHQRERRNRLYYGAELEWDLGGLIYASKETTIAREGRAREEKRRELQDRVTELYYRRLKFISDYQSADSSRRRQALSIKLKKVTTQLNTITQSWFKQQLKSHTRR